ncbi:MAG: hypothetical protein GYA21_02510 [Myxococcales bacterium]|nr:hypothetical protein [Myxococcales bacterium]
MAEQEKSPEEAVVAKGSSPLPAVLSVLSLLVGGAALALTLLRPAAAPHQANGEASEDDAAVDEHAGKGPGPLFAITGLIVNLADRDSGHYLKLSVSIELPN